MANEELVPVWLDVRTTAVPDVPALAADKLVVSLDADRRVSAGFSRTFLVRSVVTSPDGKVLLNPEDVGGGAPITQGDDYVRMLRGALNRWALMPRDSRAGARARGAAVAPAPISADAR